MTRTAILCAVVALHPLVQNTLLQGELRYSASQRQQFFQLSKLKHVSILLNVNWQSNSNHMVLKWQKLSPFSLQQDLLVATVAGWDGESAALGSCAIGEPGDECRRQTLL